MKTKLIPLIFLMPLVCVFSQTASAAVIVNDAVIGPSIYGPDHVFLSLTQSIPIGEVGLFQIDIETVTSSQYRFSYASIAEYYKLFLVGFLTRFDPAFVLQNSPIVANDNNPGSNTQIFALDQSKYFAYWDDRQPHEQTPGSNDLYGWVRITRTASGLVASSGATAIGGGIIVGTTTQVPEPTSTMLMAFGLLISLRRATSALRPKTPRCAPSRL